ncbi:MAG: ABC transporter ATP-binding protein [Anaerolineales bacterium]|nr:ABC transporter ATP-binding protein [Anaerolineales bacterium]
MNGLVEAINLSKSFGAVQAVAGLSLRVAAGEIYGLVGPDGAGKTTTLRLLCGVLRADAGEARIHGFDISTQTDQARACIGYLPQRFSLYEELTVMENIRFFAEARGLSPTEWLPRCTQILDFVGLEAFASRRAGQLSGGMKQKLGLAAALVHQPQLLLLDEPTTGVDPVTRQDFWRLIIRLAAGGQVAVLVSTPYMDEAARCTRVGFMQAGRLIVEDAPGELQATLRGRVLELCGEPMSDLRKLALGDPAVENVQMFGDRMHLRVGKGQARRVIERLKGVSTSAGVTIAHLRPVQPGLEDVFIALMEARHA